MEIIPTVIQGCYVINLPVFRDERGSFIKTFNCDAFVKCGLNTDWKEEYYSISTQRVLRGLHFQLPPHEHEKLVFCIKGEVFDVVFDLRVGSPTYGEHVSFELTEEKANMIYIPCGLAHGFYVRSKSATMLYKVSTQYEKSHDTGILWNSADIDWPDVNPILSSRDKSFLSFRDIKSPFSF